MIFMDCKNKKLENLFLSLTINMVPCMTVASTSPRSFSRGCKDALSCPNLCWSEAAERTNRRYAPQCSCSTELLSTTSSMVISVPSNEPRCSYTTCLGNTWLLVCLCHIYYQWVGGWGSNIRYTADRNEKVKILLNSWICELNRKRMKVTPLIDQLLCRPYYMYQYSLGSSLK